MNNYKEITKIIELINSNGRQGPKDLLSDEVYGWVRKGFNITYDNYKRMILSNSIRENERSNNRNAFFVLDLHNHYQLFKSNEEEIRKYLCYVVRENPHITSADAIITLKQIYRDYTPVDLMSQQNLSSHQDIIDQTIRNILVSNYFKKKNNILFERSLSKPYTYTLKEKGLELAQEIEEKIHYLNIYDNLYESEEENKSALNNSLKGIKVYTLEELKKMHEENENFNMLEYYADFISSHRNCLQFPRDDKIKTTRLDMVNYQCEVNPQHITFKTASLPNYLEGHHMVPMSAQKNFPNIKLDCIENMVALCPTCHAQITYGTKEEKKKIFDAIVEKRINDFMSIGFTKPILKVIFDIYYK